MFLLVALLWYCLYCSCSIAGIFHIVFMMYCSLRCIADNSILLLILYCSSVLLYIKICSNWFSCVLLAAKLSCAIPYGRMQNFFLRTSTIFHACLVEITWTRMFLIYTAFFLAIYTTPQKISKWLFAYIELCVTTLLIGARVAATKLVCSSLLFYLFYIIDRLPSSFVCELSTGFQARIFIIFLLEIVISYSVHSLLEPFTTISIHY